jgi:hypothetical protein
MTLQRRTQALLDLVEDDRRTQCTAIAAQAERQAAATRDQARAEARRRVREAVAEERERLQSRLAAARAELQTRQRLHEQQQAAAWLATGWQRLPQALRERWADSAARRQWVDAAVAEAANVLAPGGWRIVHAPGWPADERQVLAARLQSGQGRGLEFTEHAGLGAGLRIVGGRNVVDATVAGLLADREAIGARLLGELGVAS